MTFVVPRFLRLAFGRLLPVPPEENLPFVPSATIWAMVTWRCLLFLRVTCRRQCLLTVALISHPNFGPYIRGAQGVDVDAVSGGEAPPDSPFHLSGSRCWRDLCNAGPLEIGGMSAHLQKSAWHLPKSYAIHVGQIVLGDRYFDECVGDVCGSRGTVSSTVAGSHGPSRIVPREGRQLDLLPLVFGRVSAEDLPQPTTMRMGSFEYSRKLVVWVMLMIAMLNLHYNLGHRARAGALRSGPPTEPQYAALVRLFAAADSLIEMNPGSLQGVDWNQSIGSARVSYDGEEVCTAVPLLLSRVLPTLPPKGAAGCIPIVDLLSGFTREAVLDPALVRRRPDQVVEGWPRPRANLGKGESWDDFLVELFSRGLVEVISTDQVWRHADREVRNGVFGVEKPTSDDKKILVEGTL